MDAQLDFFVTSHRIQVGFTSSEMTFFSLTNSLIILDHIFDMTDEIPKKNICVTIRLD